jgi:hypothetical protein
MTLKEAISRDLILPVENSWNDPQTMGILWHRVGHEVVRQVIQRRSVSFSFSLPLLFLLHSLYVVLFPSLIYFLFYTPSLPPISDPLLLHLPLSSYSPFLLSSSFSSCHSYLLLLFFLFSFDCLLFLIIFSCCSTSPFLFLSCLLLPLSSSLRPWTPSFLPLPFPLIPL